MIRLIRDMFFDWYIRRYGSNQDGIYLECIPYDEYD